MDTDDIRSKILAVIQQVTDIEPSEIEDTTSFVDDLGLDSLTLLEVGVAVDFEFKLNLPDEALQELQTVRDVLDLVSERLAAQDKEQDQEDVA